MYRDSNVVSHYHTINEKGEEFDITIWLATQRHDSSQGTFVAQIENLDTGVEFHLGGFLSQRQTIEGVFAQIHGHIDHPWLQDLIPYRMG